MKSLEALRKLNNESLTEIYALIPDDIYFQGESTSVWNVVAFLTYCDAVTDGVDDPYKKATISTGLTPEDAVANAVKALQQPSS